MLSIFGWVALGHLALSLGLFYWGGLMAERSAGRSIWLFSNYSGWQRLSIAGYRIAFAIPFLLPLLELFLPTLVLLDPLTDFTGPKSGFAGQFLVTLGVAVAFASQMSMGASWRVGVSEGATGELVDGGLYSISRNPTSLGHLMLLVGMALAIPSIATLFAVLLYWLCVRFQVQQEEAVLKNSLGEPYKNYMSSTPRWLGFGVPKASKGA